MKNFAYSVIITTEDNRFTYETNDVREVIRAVFECDFEDAHICICNGYTGEVLYHNGDEPWCTDEMSLMMLGFIVEQAGAEEEEDEDSDLPTCGMCGGDVVNGVCEFCGRKVEPYTERIPYIGEVVTALFKQMADEMGAEVIPLPGRDLDVSPCLLPISKGLPS